MLMTEVILAPCNSDNIEQPRGLPAASHQLRAPPNSAVKRFGLEEESPFLMQQESTSSPKVCCIHPGRSLELSTTLGLARYRNTAAATSASPKNNFIIEHTLTDDTFSGGNMFTQRRGQLKSGRLRPLSLHYEPQLSSDACLGILPVKTERTSSQHYRSLTAPTMRHAQTIAKNNGHLYKNRSYSAAVDGNLLSSAMSIGRQLITQQDPAISGNAHRKIPSFPPVIPPTPSSIYQETTNNPQATSNELITIKIQEKQQDSHSTIGDHSTHMDSIIQQQAVQTKSDTQIPAAQPNKSTQEGVANTQKTAARLAIDITPGELSHQYNNGTNRKPAYSGRRSKGGKLSFGWTLPSNNFSAVVGSSLPSITDSKKIRL